MVTNADFSMYDRAATHVSLKRRFPAYTIVRNTRWRGVDEELEMVFDMSGHIMSAHVIGSILYWSSAS